MRGVSQFLPQKYYNFLLMGTLLCHNDLLLYFDRIEVKTIRTRETTIAVNLTRLIKFLDKLQDCSK